MITGFWTTIVFLLTIIYLWQKWKYSYWKRKGVEQLSPIFPAGNFASSMLGYESMGTSLQQIYSKISGPFGGFYMMMRPTLIFKDPELLKAIFVKDFNHFTDRGFYTDEENDPLSGHLLALDGEKWKRLRQKLSPTFTSGKLKLMFPTIKDCGENLQQYVEKMCCDPAHVTNYRELVGRFMTDIIASVAFGIGCDSINEPDVMFGKMCYKAVEPSFRNMAVFALAIMSPGLMKTFKIKFAAPDVEDFIRSIVTQTIEHREKDNIQRQDFMQLLINLRNQGRVSEDDEDNEKWTTNASNEKAMTIDEVCAQAFIFLLAGFDTSSGLMAFTLYELARHPEIQQKARESVDAVMRENSNQLTYDNLGDMKYLECCIEEAVRMYPTVPFYARCVSQAYTIPGTAVHLDKGTFVLTSVLGLHYDPQHFERPNHYDPDRFAPENRHKIKPFTYIPFGEGPRNCIGQRLGKLTVKMGLAMLLSKFKFTLDSSMASGIQFNPKNPLLEPIDGIKLKTTLRDDK